jgi:NitT/TauT family transport system permease protein
MKLSRSKSWLPVTGPLALLGVWALLSSVLRVSPLLLPTPQSAFSRLYEILENGSFLPDIWSTGYRWLGGYASACALGIPMGLLIGSSRSVYLATGFLIDFLRSLPVTALFPLFLLVFGIGDGSKLAMVFTATVFIIILNSAYGVSHATETRAKMARAFGANPLQVFWHIRLFEAMPQIVVGMRTGLSLSLIVVIVSEMFIGAQHGIGQRIFDAYSRNAVPELYGVIVFLGVLGFLSNAMFVLVERKIVYWAGQ